MWIFSRQRVEQSTWEARSVFQRFQPPLPTQTACATTPLPASLQAAQRVPEGRLDLPVRRVQRVRLEQPGQQVLALRDHPAQRVPPDLLVPSGRVERAQSGQRGQRALMARPYLTAPPGRQTMSMVKTVISIYAPIPTNSTGLVQAEPGVPVLA